MSIMLTSVFSARYWGQRLTSCKNLLHELNTDLTGDIKDLSCSKCSYVLRSGLKDKTKSEQDDGEGESFKTTIHRQ